MRGSLRGRVQWRSVWGTTNLSPRHFSKWGSFAFRSQSVNFGTVILFLSYTTLLTASATPQHALSKARPATTVARAACQPRVSNQAPALVPLALQLTPTSLLRPLNYYPPRWEQPRARCHPAATLLRARRRDYLRLPRVVPAATTCACRAVLPPADGRCRCPAVTRSKRRALGAVGGS